MEYLSNLIAYKKYKIAMNALVTFNNEEMDGFIYNIDEAIRKTVLKGEDNLTVFGTGYIGLGHNYAWNEKYNRKQVHTLLDYLEYHYYKQGFKTKTFKEDTLFDSRINIKLRKVSKKHLQ